MYIVTRNAIFFTFLRPYLFSVCVAISVEIAGIMGAYSIGFIIDFVQNKDEPLWKGFMYILLVSFLSNYSLFGRKNYTFYDYMSAIRLRRTLIIALFDKVGKLSM